MTLGRWLGLLVFIAALYVLWAVRQLVLMIFGAIAIAVAIDRLARALLTLQFRGRNLLQDRTKAIFGAIGLLVAFFLGAMLLVVPPFAAQFRELTELVPVALDRLDTWFSNLSQQPLGQWLQTVLPNPDFRSLLTQAQPAIKPLFRGGFALFASTLASGSSSGKRVCLAEPVVRPPRSIVPRSGNAHLATTASASPAST